MSESAGKIIEASAGTVNIVNDMLRNLMSEAGKLKDFTISQLPDVLQQFLQWNFYYYLTTFTVSVLLFIFWIIGGICWLRWARYEDTDGAWMGFIFGGGTISTFIGIVICCFMNLTWLQILIAPKVYLIEQAIKLIK